MVEIDIKQNKYIIMFKRKDLRPNQRDDKFELFRHAIGLADVRDILDIQHYSGSHMQEPIEKHFETCTDNNNYYMPFVNARLTDEQVGRLRRDPNVEYVVASVQVPVASMPPPQPGPTTGKQTIPWGYTKVRAAQAWAVTGKKGDGVNVAVIDTGCEPTHPDLTPAVTVNQNFTVEAGVGPRDGAHHGMHVMGTIVMQNNTQGFVGIAPNAKGWNLKAGYSRTIPPENGGGVFDTADWVEAIEYAKTNGVIIVNQSIAAPNSPPTVPWAPPIAQAIKDGYDRLGMSFPTAMGNEGNPQANSFPANSYGTLAVINLASNDLLSSTSNHGPLGEFTLPGRDIWSTVGGGAYFAHDGTSMATPHLSGILALGLAVYNDKGCPPYVPGATKKNKTLEGALRLSVDKLSKFTTDRDSRYGYGLVNAEKFCRALMGMALT